MKKYLGFAIVALTLAACSQPTTQSSTTQTQTTAATTTTAASEHQATLNITVDGNAISNSPFTLTFKDGDNLLDVMKANLQIEEKDGFVSSINGNAQDGAANKYWLFDVNGEMSPVGAKEVILKQGDVIDWKLDVLQ